MENFARFLCRNSSASNLHPPGGATKEWRPPSSGNNKSISAGWLYKKKGRMKRFSTSEAKYRERTRRKNTLQRPLLATRQNLMVDGDNSSPQWRPSEGKSKSSQNSVGISLEKRLAPQDGTPTIFVEFNEFQFSRRVPAVTTTFGSFNSNSRSTTKLASFTAAFRIQLLNICEDNCCCSIVGRLDAIEAIQLLNHFQVNSNKF
jgi:hypothetical protein